MIPKRNCIKLWILYPANENLENKFLICSEFFKNENRVNFAFIKICISRWISGASWKQSIISKPLSAWPLQMELHHIEHQTYVLMRGWPLWPFDADILLCREFPWRTELRMPILILRVGDGASPSSYRFTCTYEFLMWKLHRADWDSVLGSLNVIQKYTQEKTAFSYQRLVLKWMAFPWIFSF